MRAEISAVLTLLLLLASCAPAPEPLAISGQAMGTTYTLRFGRLPPGLDRDRLQADVAAELAAVEAAMSTWRPDSEISRFNRSRSTDWQPASPALVQVVDRALTIAELSGGALDITAGPLVAAWGFGPGDGRDRPPTVDEIVAARARVDYRMLKSRAEPPALRKLRPDLELDLSAIAKGHAVDRLAALLEARGISDYLVEIGGELRTGGRRPDGRAWRIGVEKPDRLGRSVQRVLSMQVNAAVATSGDYRNFFTSGERRFGHIIDPRSGQAVANGLASVTVLADNCTDADGLATALFVLGPDAGFDLASRQGLAVLFVLRDDGEYRERATPALTRWLAD
ncbi:MAG: FAD:protein FMN transferase [Gammaproteobacteria bacterium]|nr:MAG: FAD:protein FMN transferase [Gammaproteobacteria bacterium]